ncbi:hypothetical protein [Simiduia agarivorans]|uniref:Uncharacterized protein n=1 Tax=Simiduia agarivorans (strain DSM 21679 / JCM 13881 / BCRC 17597 / SA1) TaxID=1117647 RepID=K4KKC8_SIMAS|nr:hypothetical protein [Simiduia agarivorans]AFU98650.1 hypothetical protein M5M_07275 [Simiduia agarivorans SA1 = DSM 21679]
MPNQRLIILLLLVAYIFSPTLFGWVINPEGSWYRPFIIWVLIIVIAYFIQSASKRRRHDP